MERGRAAWQKSGPSRVEPRAHACHADGSQAFCLQSGARIRAKTVLSH